MRLLLTSAGIKNTSIHAALVDLLGKPIADSNALCIPTAGYGHPQGTPGGAWRFISGQSSTPMCELGWKSLGVLELTALPSIAEERWVPWVRETDVLLVNGGDALYLCHWMRQSGLADLLPSLRETVWVGLSAGSMVMTPRIGEDFVGWKPPTGSDSTLGMGNPRQTRGFFVPPRSRAGWTIRSRVAFVRARASVLIGRSRSRRQAPFLHAGAPEAHSAAARGSRTTTAVSCGRRAA